MAKFILSKDETEVVVVPTDQGPHTRKRSWKFPELISRVVIINPKNPAIRLIQGRV